MPAYVLVAPDAPGRTVTLVDLDEHAAETGRRTVAADALPAEVRRVEDAHAGAPPRWVWDDTRTRYPALLTAGVRVERSHDLRLCHAILRHSATCAASHLAQAPPGPWDADAPVPVPHAPSLFDALDDDAPAAVRDPLAELRAQLGAVAGSRHPGRLRLLLAAESTGALVAAEMHHDGLPWDAAVHDRILTDLLGPRPWGGARPQRLEALADEVRTALVAPALNPDSPPDLLRALRLQGFDVQSTSKWEIRGLDHAVVGPLLEYKKLSRLLSANGWAWLDQWVHDGRFRPDYVVGGVVTGRWASDGGGALQLPAQVRDAVRADPGWRLVVADAAQLEPRVLAAMSGDRDMAAAARHADLYQGVADAGVVPTRKDAKYAMLGAIYGATTGASAQLMPHLARAFPRAVALVEGAARAGERGEVVTTWLGRSSPPASDALRSALTAATGEGAGADDVRETRRRARDRGRFTRNFIVQGTAAEWAMCWMASLRRRLRGIDGRPHLVFFLHDEVVVHSPADVTDEVAAAVRDSADEAGRLLFGDAPVEFALDLSVVDSYAAAT
ncbi:bifunctional 3'-5' exonuclease/DNA polymerase [Cellulomonas shaoxiangyii]|uniref:DNA-directed DNA polymerase n=1 Tax=Cellulomonas shaoxiangyii TaxID=2566013 RepID=A0A4V1CMD3_9CELL|nr:bifunctional 3'-5' exonuclease/DNA polymerase [Cellulomonas shaoxiangyii]QCB92545.1 bifunctional 3'-5' exonuclease/DNA polymerase [Cellulomonas shaoxiangyii]TGY84832.1 bifunctional 3'-5' exonuclease/DNA polymerase [Cellulomonas shaoxiangyii]